MIIQPYSQIGITRLEIFNEIGVLVIGYHCLSQLLVQGPSGRYALGYSVEVCLWFQLAVNIIVVGVFRITYLVKWTRY